ncbi:Histone H4 [Tolypocladium capitatum]|uniref:Histone H4 n=1 Tax=Tolypocladium capitatum TaxID=45235 RepID=A0A2K3QJF5_9HYPO|nr:Histone H4 [Tolypocladium capitatum]
MPTPSSRGGPRGARVQVAKQGRAKMGGKAILTNSRHRKIIRDTILGVTFHRRLARRGGVKRISTGIYPEIRSALKARLEMILRTCVIFVEHRNAKTITTNDVIHSLRRIGQPVYGFDPDTYDGRKKARQGASKH